MLAGLSHGGVVDCRVCKEYHWDNQSYHATNHVTCIYKTKSDSDSDTLKHDE